MMSTLQTAGFNTADWVIVAVIGFSALISLVRGFVKEALSLAVWVAAFVVSFWFSEPLAAMMTQQMDSPTVRYLAAFGILFVSVLILGALINFLIAQLVRATGLSGTDRLLGVMFGVCRGVLVVLAVLVFAPKLVPLNQEIWWQQSVLIPRILVLESWSRQTVDQLSSWGKEQWQKKPQLVPPAQATGQQHP